MQCYDNFMKYFSKRTISHASKKSFVKCKDVQFLERRRRRTSPKNSLQMTTHNGER